MSSPISREDYFTLYDFHTLQVTYCELVRRYLHQHFYTKSYEIYEGLGSEQSVLDFFSAVEAHRSFAFDKGIGGSGEPIPAIGPIAVPDDGTLPADVSKALPKFLSASVALEKVYQQFLQNSSLGFEYLTECNVGDLLEQLGTGAMVLCAYFAPDNIPSGGSAPSVAESPSISGDLTVGSTLSVYDGLWNADPAPSIARSWVHEGSTDSLGTGTTYVTGPVDVGKSIKCIVTASNTHGTASAETNVLGPIVDAEPE